MNVKHLCTFDIQMVKNKAMQVRSCRSDELILWNMHKTLIGFTFDKWGAFGYNNERLEKTTKWLR